MMIELPGKHVPIRMWAKPEEVELKAIVQLEKTAALPWAFHHVAVMPDVHLGIGATVGSVIAMKNAIAPAAVGVDIGCGMSAVRTSLTANNLPDSLKDLRHTFERTIPVGYHQHTSVPNFSYSAVQALNFILDDFVNLDSRVHKLRERAEHQIGTLGGGNHFIELCLDDNQRVWLMLHSGSRNIGNELAKIHITTAKKLAYNLDIPDPDLAVFLSGTSEMEAYRRDLTWAQTYAMTNRSAMMELLTNQLIRAFPEIEFDSFVSCHHNYVSEETHFGEEVLVTRKGAISAREGELGIIPGSMGTKSYIVRGLGNPESFHSASHGAGRRMSRTQARKTFTAADFAEQTRGVECRKDTDVIDEIPGAYKDIDAVMANQADLVAIVHTLKQIMCVKG